jgi:hypothetical protein
MANYNSNGQSFINGLSDFWLLYFKEIDQLKALYQGTEIQVGQSYLDLLGLLLNSSLQDAPTFNKEYWKLFQIKESDLRFKAGTTSTDNRYQYPLPNNAVFVRHLNNKILNVTANLDKDVDFYLDETERRVDFVVDPLNAYEELTLGTGNSAIRIRSRVPGDSTIRIWLDDTGVALTVTRSGFDICIQYDGPANTNTTLARDIVQVLNTQVDIRGIVLAELAGLGTGTASPPGTGGYTDLLRVAVSPLDNYATRIVDQAFGGKFVASSLSSWVSSGVEKGDILRLVSGPTVGSPIELEINAVRPSALYLEAGGSLSVNTGDHVDFAVLRAPSANNSIREPMAQSGQVVQTDTDGTLVAATRQFSSPSAAFNAVHEGDILEVLGVSNVGYGTILEVIDPLTVTIGLTVMVAETPVNWNLISVVDPANTNTDGTLTNLGTGSATFSAPTASFTAAAVGTVLKISRAGIVEKYAITGRTSATQITVAADPSVPSGAALSWGWAKYIASATTVVYSPPAAWPEPGSFAVEGRRLLDGAAVQEGVDYDIFIDNGTVRPKTVWETSVSNTVSYNYRTAVVENVTPLQNGVNGVITPGSPNVFSAVGASFNANHIGHAIRIANSGHTGVTNNGVHYIAAVVSATSVQLTSDKVVPSTADPNNGALTWSLLRRGTLTASTTAAPITELITEISFWAPDVLVDRFHLYNTFGYLINRYERSSEEYRTLIRGIFQLFMLGPTLERMESAINTVAGLPVIRDDGEILVAYENDALDSGSDGVFDYTANTFSSATAAFTPSHSSHYIYAKSGTNANKLFRIASVTDANTVVLADVPTSDSSVEWELTATAEHRVITSRTPYVFRRDIPLRDRVTDSSNFGVHIFRAFEVMTAVFDVTDYIEDPTWWEFVQIPRELIPNESPERRQSTPVLFENVVNPADGGKIGDPGIYIGADTEGYVPASSILRSGINGSLTGDPFYPLSNTVYFDAATGAFTASDVGNYVEVGGTRYRIMLIVSPTRVQVEAFVDVADQVGLAWNIRSGALPKRHKAAFVILDKVLKHHLFSVRFDIALMNQLSLTLIEDLQELVLIAKPSYTYIVLTPAALFDEILHIDEDLELDASMLLGGDAGEVIAGNASPLVVIGASWRVGQWFRPISTTSTFAAPAASIASPLGAAAAGFVNLVNRIYITHASFTSSAAPIQVGDLIMTATGTTTAGATLTVAGGQTTLTFAAAHVTDTDLMQYIRITGSGLGNNGTYRIGAVLSTTQVRLSPQASITEAGLNTEFITAGSTIGRIAHSTEGEVIFTDLSGRAEFAPAHVGTYIRRPFLHTLQNQYFPIYEIISNTQVKIAVERRVHPVAADPDISVALVSNVLTCTAGDYVFSESMAYEDRRAADPATALEKQYFIECTSGANTGQTYRIDKYLAPNQVRLSGGITAAAVDTRLIVIEAPVVLDEITEWEHVRDQITISSDHQTVVFSTPAQDVNGAVPYTAYGVREPIDPTVSVFDDSSGDTMYSLGMPDPRQARGRSRTGRDTDMREEPLAIFVSNMALLTEAGEDLLTEAGEELLTET